MGSSPDRPIGVFDSGLGGLTVLKEIINLLPGENTIYFGDSGRAPYGSKSPETIGRFSQQIVRFLQRQQVKIIVIACNTASACAYDLVRNTAGVPVIEVVAPGAAAAARITRNGRIGVIGTRSTVESGVYIRAIRQSAGRPVEILQQACPLFVSLAEEGWWDNSITRQIAETYLADMRSSQIDTLMLGCTHYPLLSTVISETMGPSVRLVNAGGRVAAQVRQTLLDRGILNETATPGWHRYYTSDSVSRFEKLGGAFLGETIDGACQVDIEQDSV
ncbi:MAG TPA: glutamate racemase [Clostridiales bacterium]|nr:glutamate racemase [Clostridiales bacterium]